MALYNLATWSVCSLLARCGETRWHWLQPSHHDSMAWLQYLGISTLSSLVRRKLETKEGVKWIMRWLSACWGWLHMKCVNRMVWLQFSTEKTATVKADGGSLVCWVSDHEYDEIMRFNGRGSCWNLWSFAGMPTSLNTRQRLLTLLFITARFLECRFVDDLLLSHGFWLTQNLQYVIRGFRWDWCEEARVTELILDFEGSMFSY